MNRDKARFLGAIVLASCFLLIASCSSGGYRLNSPQDTVDSMRALTRDLVVPDHYLDGNFTRTASDFDVNTYFTVLDHLSVEPGYVLDYVYLGARWFGGNPIIYARPSDQPAYETLEHAEEHAADYLEHIVVDDSAEGYFQFVVLYVLGDQFYLWWHSNYNDLEIVCDQDGLEAVLAKVDAFSHNEGSSVMREQAEKLDLEPTVEMREDVAVVRFVTFTMWGGFAEVLCTISREFPHQIVDWEEKELLAYDCGLRF